MKQLVHVVGAPLSTCAPAAPAKFVVEPCFEPPGEEGRLGATEENPDMVPASGGEFGTEVISNVPPIVPSRTALGVEVVRGIFCRLSVLFLVRLSETDCVEA